MHELSLLTGVVDAVERARAAAGADRVLTVALQVGTLSGAVPEALLAAWPLAVAGSGVEGAELSLEEVRAAVWCPACAGEVEIDEFYALRCPACDTPTGTLARGRELTVAYVDLDVPGHR
ncbi:hydrogenase maturation nickel metallochaperone HypA [Nocardioides hungaricus]